MYIEVIQPIAYRETLKPEIRPTTPIARAVAYKSKKWLYKKKRILPQQVF